MANTIQLKRSSVVGKIPDAGNVSVGEPVINLADQTLYTKNGSGDIIVIGTGVLGNLSDVSNASPTTGQVLTYDGAQWAPAAASGGTANTVLGVIVQNAFTANGTGSTYTLTNSTANANSLIVFVDSVLQEPITNYTVSGTTLTFTSAPANGANIDVRYFAADEFDIALGELSNVANTTPLSGQALIWSGAQWAPANVSTDANVISVNGQTGIVTLDYATVLFQDERPSATSGNVLWWQSNIGKLKLYYDDGTSAQWVDASPGGVTNYYTNANYYNNTITEVTIGDETSSSNTFYPVFTTTTSGELTTSNVNTSDLKFTPSTGVLETRVLETQRLTITGNTTSLGHFAEKANIIVSGLAANTNYNINDGVVHFHTATANANATVNLQGFTNVSVGNSITVAVLNTNGATAYKVNTVQIDGTTANVTTRWLGGTAPTSGNASNVDIYSFSVIKTAALTYSVFASQSQFG